MCTTGVNGTTPVGQLQQENKILYMILEPSLNFSEPSGFWNLNKTGSHNPLRPF